MKKRLIAALLTLVMLFSFTGCNAADFGSKKKIEITMCLWDKSITRQLTPWLEEQFPDIQFTFIVGYNTMAYYADLTDRGEDIPDIITCRRFSLNDASHMADQLMDLSETEIVGTFYDSYIENNRETDGAIRWLPMCAEVDGFIANLDVFEKYNVPVPTNYAEFVSAIDAFEKVGIRGFNTDWHADYTSLETMQGSAIPQLMSLEGTTWRRAYESEKVDGEVGLDDKVWPQVFERYTQFLKDVKVTPEDAEAEWGTTTPKWIAGEQAIMRGTANDCVYARTNYGINAAMLPYFGETAEDNWILTYPMCQVSVSKKVEENSKKKEAVLQVLDAIFSEEGQRRMACGSSVLSYNKTVNIERDPSLEYVQDCIDRNHMYMRLASTEIFAISKDVVGKMITDGLDAKQAYEEFNTQLTAAPDPAEQEVIITQEKAYDYTFGKHGSPAASSLMNTMREGMGDDIAIGYSSVVSSPIFAGDYTMQQLKWLMTFKVAAYRGEYTGAEIRRIMEWLVNVKADGSNPIRHYNNIPVTSGMEYTIIDNGDGTYTLDKLTVNGKELDENATYNLLLMGEDNFIEAEAYCNCPMPEDLKAKRVEMTVTDYNSYDCMLESVQNCGQLLAPTDYVTYK